MMKLLSQLNKSDLAGKKVLLRVDFNVAVEGDKIVEPFKIIASLPTIRHLVNNGAIVTLASHIESVKSFDSIRDQIMKILGVKVDLLENTRVNPGEKTDDENFAKQLADGFDLYINDAFAAAHSAHASVHAITKLLPSYAGFIIESETKALADAISAPREGKVVVLGGAKISTKMPMITNFLDKAEAILLGGKLINEHEELAKLTDPKIILPLDTNPAEGNALDIGPKAIAHYCEIIRTAKFVIWNGPMGKYEDAPYADGTKALAEAIASAPRSIIGGGDTIAAVNALVPSAKFTYISTGGGAMLEFLAGKRLPALEALGYYGQ